MDTMITIDTLLAALDETYAQFSAILDLLDVDAPAPAEGEWNARQVLSHVIGALNRAPVQAGYFLVGAANVPIIFNDPYWQAEYEGAPRASFQAALRVAVEGNKAFLRTLDADLLWSRAIERPPFGTVPLAAFLQTAYHGHVRDLHVPQLRAFLTA